MFGIFFLYVNDCIDKNRYSPNTEDGVQKVTPI